MAQLLELRSALKRVLGEAAATWDLRVVGEDRVESAALDGTANHKVLEGLGGDRLAAEGVARTASRIDFLLYKAWYGAGTM